MPAPTGNKNAQKWTYERIDALLTDIECVVDTEPVLYLGQALAMFGAYTELWSRIRKSYGHIEEVYDRIMVIEQKFESKLVVGAMLGKYNASTAQLVLKAKYGYANTKPEALTEEDRYNPYAYVPLEQREARERAEAEAEAAEEAPCAACGGQATDHADIPAISMAHPHTGSIQDYQDYICDKVRRWNEANPDHQVPDGACHMLTDNRPPFSHYIEFSGGFFHIL